MALPKYHKYITLFLLFTVISPPFKTYAQHLMFSSKPYEMQNDSNSNTLRVMTYNIRVDNPEDGEHAWVNRKRIGGQCNSFSQG